MCIMAHPPSTQESVKRVLGGRVPRHFPAHEVAVPDALLVSAVVRSQSAKIFSWLCSPHPGEALAQLLCEKSRAAKWSPFL
jgi:hypothetical protein